MALQSMTGFSRVAGEAAGDQIVWELRSVNGKGLDARIRLPQGLERLELPARQLMQKRLARGNIQVNLNLQRKTQAGQPVVNEEFLRDITELAKRLEAQFGCAPASADGLLALKGVLEMPDQGNGAAPSEAMDTGVLALLDQAISALIEARESEGRALDGILRGQLDRIEQLTLKAEADPSRDPQAIRERLAAQVRLLMDAAAPLDEQRLYAEAAFLATKADIREEIDRLKTHIASARDLLASGVAVGRKLDFLAQEFNRESNTLCSKSNASAVTAIGLDLKAVVDQFREQIQNLE
ncbi:MAG: YicC/YloC family endoribonuclease [Mesorhizobium sp.]